MIAIVLTLPAGWCWPLLVALTVFVYFSLKQTQKYRYLTLQQDGTVLLENKTGQQVLAKIRPTTVVYPFLIILHVKHSYAECIVLWPDSADANLLRRFRIWLYWYWPSCTRSTK